jgi:hypothetical protein
VATAHVAYLQVARSGDDLQRFFAHHVTRRQHMQPRRVGTMTARGLSPHP